MANFVSTLKYCSSECCKHYLNTMTGEMASGIKEKYVVLTYLYLTEERCMEGIKQQRIVPSKLCYTHI